MIFENVFFGNDGGGAGASQTRTPTRKPAKPVWSSWDKIGVVQDILNDILDLSGLREAEITELCNFIAHGCTTPFGADLSHYCHAMSSDRDYEPCTNRIIRRLVDGIKEIWSSEANQEKIFPEWFENRDVRDASFMSVAGSKKYEPSNVAIGYKIYNMVAKKLGESPEHWHFISGQSETPRLVSLNVA